MGGTSSRREDGLRVTGGPGQGHRELRRIGGAHPDGPGSGLAPTDGLPGVGARGLPGARLRRVVAYIDANVHRALPLAELSGAVNMSPFHFARLFKASTGVPPHRFVVRRRMDHAMALLAEAGASIDAVARTVGFRSASHFTTAFRRVVGLTPSRYRVGAGSAALGVGDSGADQRMTGLTPSAYRADTASRSNPAQELRGPGRPQIPPARSQTG